MSKFVIIDGKTGKTIKSDSNPLLSEEDTLKSRIELETYLKFIAEKPDLMETITDCRMTYSVFGVERNIDNLLPFRQERIKTLQEKIVKKILSGKMKVDGSRGNWSNGFLGSRWFDIDSASVALTCRVSFYSRRQFGNDGDSPYRMLFSFEEREVVDCENPECEKRSKWFKKCSCCHSAHYCGEVCQKADWKRHKAEMKEQKEEDEE